MAQEGLKKRNIQRIVQKVHVGSAISSIELSSTATSEYVELGFPVEKLTVVCTGNLAATVQPLVGPANANAAINATTTPSTTVLTHMAASVLISRVSGTGTVVLLAK